MLVESIDNKKTVMTFENKIDTFDVLADEEYVEITPLVKSLSGVIELSPEFDYKTEYGNHLLQKYK